MHYKENNNYDITILKSMIICAAMYDTYTSTICVIFAQKSSIMNRNLSRNQIK